MARVLGIGVGLFILAFIWVFCLFICVTLSRAQGGIASAGIGSVLLAVVLTLILWFFPRESVNGDVEIDIKKYDYTALTRTAMISLMGIFMVIGFAMYVTTHIMERVQAKPVKKTVQTR